MSSSPIGSAVQSSDGKIPAAYHSPGDVEDVVNFKKAIAAAF